MFIAMIGGIELLVILGMLLLAPLSLAVMAFWIWMLIDAIQSKGLGETEKIVWVLVIALTHFIGALVYFFVGRPKAKNPRPALLAPAGRS